MTQELHTPQDQFREILDRWSRGHDRRLEEVVPAERIAAVSDECARVLGIHPRNSSGLAAIPGDRALVKHGFQLPGPACDYHLSLSIPQGWTARRVGISGLRVEDETSKEAAYGAVGALGSWVNTIARWALDPPPPPPAFRGSLIAFQYEPLYLPGGFLKLVFIARAAEGDYDVWGLYTMQFDQVFVIRAPATTIERLKVDVVSLMNSG